MYWRLEWRAQNYLLLAASYFFTPGGTGGSFCSCFFPPWRISSIANKIAGIDAPGASRALLTASLAMNFGFLGVFKYFNFFAGSLSSLLASLGIHGISIGALNIILPPGISFYTFQEVAYIISSMSITGNRNPRGLCSTTLSSSACSRI